MTKQSLQIKGMHCASCASIITKKLSAIPHINSVSVNYGTEKAKLDFDDTKVSIEKMNQEIGKLGYTLISHQKENGAEHHQATTKEDELSELKNKMDFMLPITLTVFALMMWEILTETTLWMPALPLPMEVLNMISIALATVALFWVGKPYLLGIARFVRHGVANMDTLWQVPIF